MKPFLLDGDAHFQKPTAYYMYRNVGLTEDVALLNCNHLRYDLTVLESGRIGREFVKTIGHYHPLKPGTNMQYPEIYEVIHGVAVLVIQKANNVEHKVSDACLAKITAPAKVVIPSGYGHVTVNIGSKPLVLANLVSDQFSSLYEPYRKMRGASYYIVAQEGKPELIANRVYSSIPEPRMIRPKDNLLNISRDIPLYTATRFTERFRWLNFPEEFAEELGVEELFDAV